MLRAIGFVPGTRRALLLILGLAVSACGADDAVGEDRISADWEVVTATLGNEGVDVSGARVEIDNGVAASVTISDGCRLVLGSLSAPASPDAEQGPMTFTLPGRSRNECEGSGAMDQLTAVFEQTQQFSLLSDGRLLVLEGPAGKVTLSYSGPLE